eukprot:m.42245 g.42245  ORF g.42245 m.42245 type:complete len:55 (+) comp12867_c0_seq2:513-677(+)
MYRLLPMHSSPRAELWLVSCQCQGVETGAEATTSATVMGLKNNCELAKFSDWSG